MSPISPDAILLLVANPVDILTHFARKLSGLPESQVLGTGTSLDSARLRGALARKAEVSPSSIDAYVLGEHGDSQFVSENPTSLFGVRSMVDKIAVQIAWSSASIGTTPLHLAIPDLLTSDFKTEIATHTRTAAGSIIAAKGCTSYGIGGVAASICKYILFDSRTVRPLSFYQPELDCCLSMPAVIGRKGIVRAMPIKLDEEEINQLKECAKGLRAVIKGAEEEVSANKELQKALGRQSA